MKRATQSFLSVVLVAFSALLGFMVGPARGGFGPAQGAGGGTSPTSSTLSDVLANGADANSVPITGMKSVTFGSGNGVISQLQGPTDQTFRLAAGTAAIGKSVVLQGGDDNTAAGNYAEFTVGGGDATTGGAITFTSGDGSGGNGATILAAGGTALAAGTITFSGGSAQTADMNAGGITISSGASKGSGSGTLAFQTATAGGSGSTTRNASTKMTINGSGTTTITPAAGSTALTLTGGTTTTSAPPLSATQTWNDGAVTFRGLEFAVTETSDAAASSYIRILGGASATTHEFSILKGGIVAATGNYQGTSGTLVGFTASATDPTGTPDTNISRNAAGIVQFGTSAAGILGGWTATTGTLTKAINDTSNSLTINQATGTGGAAILISQTAGVDFALRVKNQGAQNSLYLQQFGTNSSLDQIVLTQNRGTIASATNTASGDLLGGILVYGAGGSNSTDAACIRVYQDGAVSTFVPGRIVFHTASAAGGAATLPKVCIDSTGNVKLNSGLLMGWTSSASDPTGALTTNISQNASGVLQIGTSAANASGSLLATTATLSTSLLSPLHATTDGAATAVTFRAADGSSTAGGLATVRGGNGNGTDKAGGGLTSTPGLPTGTGTSEWLVQSGFVLATGSTAQTAYDRLRISSKTFACSTSTGTNNVYLVLSNAVSNTGVGCMVDYVLEVIDGSNHCSTITGCQVVASENRNGTVVATCSTAGTSNQATSSQTTFTSLACTTTVAVSGTNVSIRLTPSWSGGTPTIVRVTYQARVSGQGSLTPQ